MSNQHLFNALNDVCGFTAIQSDMQEIINAVKKDEEEERQTIECLCRTQGGCKSWQTDQCPYAAEQHNDNWVCTRLRPVT